MLIPMKFKRYFVVGKGNLYNFKEIHGYVDGNILRLMHYPDSMHIYSKGYFRREEVLCVINKDGQRIENGMYSIFSKKSYGGKEEIAAFGTFSAWTEKERDESKNGLDHFQRWTRVKDF